MRKAITYADAVRMLGGDGPVVKALDRIFLGALGVATAGGSDVALGLIDAKLEVVRLSNGLIGSLRDKVSGLSRHSRTQRLEAAHAIIVVVAFLESLEELDLPFDLADLELSRQEVVDIATPRDLRDRFTHSILTAKLLAPEVHRPFELTVVELGKVYVVMVISFGSFLSGLSVWDGLDTTARDRIDGTLVDLPTVACRRYQELYRRLAVDFPEFALWADLGQQQATRDVVRTGLAGLERSLAGLTSGHALPHQLRSLSLANRAPLDKQFYDATDLPDGMELPTLADAYIDPRFRIDEPGADSDLSSESWWNEREPRTELAAFLAGYLTSPRCALAPLVVLGQPGAGKSVLTKILAARLPAEQYLAIRVPLRRVPVDGLVQEQVEHGIRELTHERLHWADLARSAADAQVLPVLLLDGLDELLQATGAHRADYLAQVADFQRRERDLGRAVAVVVTTRTAVANRCRLPEGALAVRLEPFDEHQVATWLEAWNALNRPYFTARGLLPLPAGRALAQEGLATQPLLLFMLALYDADANALQSESGPLAGAELYRRLLTRFARREVTKHRPGLSPEELDAAIESELVRLAVAAFAMFNRGRQWVTQQELEADLRVLAPRGQQMDQGFEAGLSQAEEVIGRFFFVHQAEATREDRTLRTYEFLHATFGEYLVAFLLHRVLAQLKAQTAAAAGPFGAAPPQDGLLHALASFALLTSRRPVLAFLKQMIPAAGEYTPVLLRLFRDREYRRDHSHADYEPARLPATRRAAYFSANLVLLAIADSAFVTASELFGAGDLAVDGWRRSALLWKSAVLDEEWAALIGTVNVGRSGADSNRQVTLSLSFAEVRREDPDPAWFLHRSKGQDYRAAAHRSERDFLCLVSLDAFAHDLGESNFPHLFTQLADGRITSVGRTLSDLWRNEGPSELELFQRAVEVIRDAKDMAAVDRHLTRVLQLLCSSVSRLDPAGATELLLGMADLMIGLDQRVYYTISALHVVARDPSRLDQLIHADSSLLSLLGVTLLELEVDLDTIQPAGWVWTPATAMALNELRAIDPLLYHQARRIIRTEGHRYGLHWPEEPL